MQLIFCLVALTGVENCVALDLFLSNTYSYANDNRCVSPEVNKLAFKSSVANELHCSSLCNQNSDCKVFMFISRSNSCVLYNWMSPLFYKMNSFVSDSGCRVFKSVTGAVSTIPFFDVEWTLMFCYFAL